MKNILIVVGLIILTGGVFVFTRSNEEDHCRKLYREIRDEIEEENYCEVNEDCRVLELGGSYIAFGCYHFVNKDTDKNYFYQRAREYYEDCVLAINECDPSPAPQCVEGKCVYIEEEKKDEDVACQDYTYSTCPKECIKLCTPSHCSYDEEFDLEICTDDCDGPGSCV